jgi:hypothetical protein
MCYARGQKEKRVYGSLELSLYNLDQTFTHVAGTPDRDQYTGGVLLMSLFRN